MTYAKHLVKYKGPLLAVQAGMFIMIPVLAATPDCNWTLIGCIVLCQIFMQAVLMQVAREELVVMLQEKVKQDE